ncbi:hypothetical protein INT81_07580 [Riemerella anatipestifer]|nr:hypothetical protein [Riemerella anatipestifer]
MLVFGVPIPSLYAVTALNIQVASSFLHISLHTQMLYHNLARHLSHQNKPSSLHKARHYSFGQQIFDTKKFAIFHLLQLQLQIHSNNLDYIELRFPVQQIFIKSELLVHIFLDEVQFLFCLILQNFVKNRTKKLEKNLTKKQKIESYFKSRKYLNEKLVNLKKLYKSEI